MKNISSIPFGKLNIVDSNDKPLNYEIHNPMYIAKIDNYIINDYNAFSKSIENLNRLGLIEISYTKYFTDKLCDLPPSTRNKLYVAITRAHGKVYLVNE